MPAMQIRASVEMDGGEKWTVVADQRDVAKYEAQDFYDPGKRITMTRFIAWTASRRQGLTKLSWPAFDAVCVEASDPEDEDTELDPTNRTPSAEA
jgi:hypothetical protein